MNPDAEIPPVNDYVINLLKSPHENKASYKVAVEEIKKQFQLNEVKSKMNHKSAAEVFKKYWFSVM